MKIIVNARFLTQPVSGVQRYGIECSRQIKKIYPNTIFVAPKEIFNKSVAEELGVQIIGQRGGHLWEQLDLVHYLKKEGNPPLLSLCNTAPAFYRNNFVTLHDLAFHHHPEWNSKWFSAWYNWLVPRIARNARKVFTVSETVKRELMQAYGLKGPDIAVTYNGIGRHMRQQLARVGQKEKMILSVGTFNVRKNHQRLLQGFIESGLGATYQLVFIGDKNKVFREGGLSEAAVRNNNIEIYQHVSEDELADLYSRAGVVVSLSMYEGFGIPMLEGLHSRCKLLCSDIPVYRELYGTVTRFCNPYDVADIAAALRFVALQGSVPGEAARSALLEVYNYEHAARVIIDNVMTANK